MVNMGSVDFNLEQNVEKILNGEGMEVTGIDSAPEHIKPVILRKNVCYIVSALIFNSKVSCLWVFYTFAAIKIMTLKVEAYISFS